MRININIFTALCYLFLSIYEFYIIHKYSNNNDPIFIYIIFKSLYNIGLFICLIKYIKYIYEINFIAGTLNIIIWSNYSDNNDDYESVLFNEFLVFQFNSSIYIIYILYKKCETHSSTEIPVRQEETNNINLFHEEELSRFPVIADVINSPLNDPLNDHYQENILTNATPIKPEIINVNGIKFEQDNLHT